MDHWTLLEDTAMWQLLIAPKMPCSAPAIPSGWLVVKHGNGLQGRLDTESIFGL